MTLNPVVPLNARIPEWTFAERLRKARRDLGMTQAQIAERLDVKQSTYEAWETGRNKPDVTTLAEKLEGVTGISRLWFVGWVEAPTSPDTPGPDGGVPGNVAQITERLLAEPAHSRLERVAA